MIRLRPPDPLDFARFTALERAPDAAPFVHTYDPEEHARLDATHLVIERDGEFDGFLILVLDPDGESVELRRIVVARKGRGTGRAALLLAEGIVRERFGRTRMWLDVHRANAPAMHLYASLGYRPLPPPPGADPDNDFLEKRL